VSDPNQSERVISEGEFIEFSARLTFNEFMLELIVANDFAPRSDAQEGLRQFREQFLYLMRYKMTGVKDDMPDSLSLAIQDESIKLAERFFDKCADRIAQIQNIMQQLKQ